MQQCRGRTLRARHRPPTAGDVLRALGDAPTLAAVLDHQADVLALSYRERLRLRAALARTMGPDGYVAVVRQVLEADRPDRPDDVADLAGVARELRRVAEAGGWTVGRPLPRRLVALAQHLAMDLPPEDRRHAPGVLAGLFDLPAEVFAGALTAADEDAGPDEDGAAAAFAALAPQVQADIATDTPRARWRGAVAAAQAGMPQGSLVTMLRAAGEADPAGCARRAYAAASRPPPARR